MKNNRLSEHLSATIDPDTAFGILGALQTGDSTSQGCVHGKTERRDLAKICYEMPFLD
jgi:hypothetical protein